jgi:hypothetical protein
MENKNSREEDISEIFLVYIKLRLTSEDKVYGALA